MPAKRVTYQFTGDVSLLSLTLAVAIGTGVCLFVGIVWLVIGMQAKAIVPPSAWLGLSVPVALAITATMATASALRWRAVRSRAAAACVTLAVGIVALMIGWTLRALPVGAFDPSEFSWIDLTAKLRTAVVWPGAVIGEPWSRLLMGSEVALIGALALRAGRSMLRTPRCRSCRTWCDLHQGIAELEPVDIDAARQHIDAGDWGFFRGLGSRRGQKGARLRFDLAECPKCAQTCAVSSYRVSRWGRARLVVSNLLVGADARRTVRTLGRMGR